MKAVAMFLLGIVAIIAGIAMRTCDDGLIAQISHSWCGAPPRDLAFAHAHCAGCVMIAAGVGLLALSPLLLGWGQPARIEAGR